MKAKFGTRSVGGLEEKAGSIELDEGDTSAIAEKGGKLLKNVAVGALVLGSLSALGKSQAEWDNAVDTLPLAAGPVQIQYGNQSFWGDLINRELTFLCDGSTMTIPCAQIKLVRTDGGIFAKERSRLTVSLVDGSEFRQAEFLQGTALQFQTKAGRTVVRPKFEHRWNPFVAGGYRKFRLVGSPQESSEGPEVEVKRPTKRLNRAPDGAA